MKRILTVALTTGLLTAGVLFSQARGRMYGSVKDENGEPLVGVQVVVISTENQQEVSQHTSKKGGRYAIAVVDATKRYLFRFELEGYQAHEEEIKLPVQSNQKRDVTLYSWKYLRENKPEAADGDGKPVSVQGDPAATAFNQGVEALRNEDLAAAEEKFKKALSIDAELNVAHSALARVYLRQEKYQQAAEAAERALELKDRDEAALAIRFQAYESLGDTEKARKAYDALAKVTAPEVAAYNIGVEAYQAGNYVMAKEHFEEAVGRDAKLLPGWLALARTNFRTQDWAGAAQAIEQALVIDGSNVDALAIRYDAYRSLGDQTKAQEALVALQKAAPERLTGANYEKGVKLFNANKVAEALEAFSMVLTVDPSHAESHYMLGLSYVNMGENAKAKEHLEKYVELAPDGANAGTAKEMLKYL